MKSILFPILLALPIAAASQSISQSQIVGEWEWLGNSFTKSSDLNNLVRTGPSIKIYHADGKYEYISTYNNKIEPPIKGTWRLENNILTITRPDNGTF